MLVCVGALALLPLLSSSGAYALHHTKLHPLATFAALGLLQQLKAHFPTTQGLLGHRPFISTFVLM